MSKSKIFYKEYSVDELADVDRDISEAFNSDIDTDEHDFDKGKVRISIVWCSENDCDCTGFQHSGRCPNHWSNCDGQIPF